MLINEIEVLVNNEIDPEIIYKAIKKYNNDINDGRFPDYLIKAYKEDLWQAIDIFQKNISESSIELLSARKLKNLATIKSKIWIK